MSKDASAEESALPRMKVRSTTLFGGFQVIEGIPATKTYAFRIVEGWHSKLLRGMGKATVKDLRCVPNINPPLDSDGKPTPHFPYALKAFDLVLGYCDVDISDTEDSP